MANSLFAATFTLIFLFLFGAGCVKTEYVCGDGTIVADPKECKLITQIIERNITIERIFFVCPDGEVVVDPANCTNLYICLDGRIVKNVTDCPKCITDADCNFWEECVNGNCRTKKGMCTAQEDCEVGFLCAGHKCVQAPFVCKGDIDCEEDEICVNGICRKKITRCTYDTQCRNFEQCSDGVCKLIPGYCYTQADCGFLYACISNKCVKDCTLENIGRFYSTKISDASEIRDAAAVAIQELRESTYQEAQVYKQQLDANLRAGLIEAVEYSNIFNSIAIFLYVRDRINYALAPLGDGVQADRITLRRKIGKCDEKAVLLISMLRSVGINATLGIASTKNETCTVIDCDCLSKMDHAYAEIYLPEFKKLHVFREKIHFADMSYCARGDWIAVDPACSGCTFAYGTKCGPFHIPAEALKK